MHKFILRGPWAPPARSSAPLDSILPKPPSPPQPPQPPRLKTLEELASTVQLVDEQPPKPRGLFWDLLGGDHHALGEDILEHPDRYDDRLVTLMRELAEGRRKLEELTSDEQNLLNRGTLDFAQLRPDKSQTPKAPPPPKRTKPSDETRVVEPPPMAEPGVDVPETPGGMRPYWWV